MKLRRLFVIAITFVLVSLFAASFKVAANAVETSELITVQGAQIRTTGNAGIRFVAKEEYEGTNETAWGIILAYGEAEANDEFVIDGTVNGKAVLKGEVTSTKEGVFTATLYNVPTDAYAQVVTARAYVVDGDKVVYSQNVAVKSLAEVALKAKNDGDASELVANVVEAMEGYKKVFVDKYNNYYVDSAVYESNHANLAKEFIKDVNKFFDLELDPATAFEGSNGTQPFAKALVDTTASAAATDTNLFKFYADETMRAKWGWLLNVVKQETDIDTAKWGNGKPAIDALLANDAATAGEKWYGGCYPLSSIMSLLAGQYESSGYGGYSIENNLNVLGKFIDYNNTVYADLAGVQIVKAEDEITIPTLDLSEGYEGKYDSAGEEVAFGSKWTVTAEDKMFVVKTSAIEYTVKFMYEDSEITELETTYNIEAAKELPVFNLDGYAFEAWYDNAELTGEPVTAIAKGSIGNKVYYAKLVEVSADSALIEYVHCDYSFEQLRDEFMADWTTYSDSGKRVFDLTNNAERKTTYAQWLAVKAVLANATFAAKYDWLLDDIANAIYAQNPYYKSQLQAFVTEGASAISENTVYYHFIGELTGFWNQTTFLGTATYVTVPMTAWTVESTLESAQELLLSKYTITQELSTIGADLIVPERAGYTFAGWYANAEYTGEAITKVSAENTKLYAKWEAVAQ